MNIFKTLIFFVSILVLSRLIPHPPNFTPLIAGVVFLPFLINDRKIIVFLPAIILLISDLILGFHNHMLWTYGSFILISLLTIRIFKENLQRLLLTSFLAPSVFFVVSNFGVWFSSGIYSKDIIGLFECYILALPFYSSSLLSTLLFATAFYLVRHYIVNSKALSN